MHIILLPVLPMSIRPKQRGIKGELDVLNLAQRTNFQIAMPILTPEPAAMNA
jgi:hypothetical protein